MRVLVVDGFDQHDEFGNGAQPTLADRAIGRLRAQGVHVEVLSLVGAEFAGFMTAAERRAYETETPLLDPSMIASAELVASVDGLLFVYPTTLFGVPPVLKSWLERVMVLGVAFSFDDKQRVRPGLTNIRHLGVVTSSPHTARATWRARDLGYRTIMRTLRLNCHARCRRTFVRVGDGAPAGRLDDRLARSLRAWKP